eukprot:UN08916
MAAVGTAVAEACHTPRGSKKKSEAESPSMKKRSSRSSQGRSSITVNPIEIQKLVGANDALTSKNNELRTQMAKIRTELMMKSDSLIKEKERLEET